MPARSSSSPVWLTLAVVLPLVLLAVLAAFGTRSQFAAAWAEARAEAGRLAPALVSALEHDLRASLHDIPVYPDPPIPGTPSPKDAILDGIDVAALEELCRDPDAGLSPAGLPRRALAALVIHRLDPSRLVNLTDILTLEAPSVLTSRAIEEVVTDEFAKQRWRKEEKIRNLVRRAPVVATDGWLRQDGRFLYLTRQEGSLAYAEFPDTRLAFDGELPPWARVHLALTSDPPARGALASAPVGLGHGLELRVTPEPGLIEAPVRRMQRWTFAILGASFVTAATALVVLQRTLSRERQLNEMKSRFVASVSHELRAPVASIRLMADALEAEKVAPETAREFHRLIAREGARLSTLVGNVLDHARIEQSRKVWNLEPCDLSPLVADTVRVMEPLAGERRIALAAELAIVEATVDADAVQQALVNLLDNAIKFSPPDTRVVVALTTEGSHWRLTVTDQGPGIPVAEQSRIFERFYRPGDELRRETQGTGIGLSLVKSIAEAHGGVVAVSRATGTGSIFSLTLPLSP